MYRLAALVDDPDDGWSAPGVRKPPSFNIFKTVSEYLQWGFVVLALFSLTLQATRTVEMSPEHDTILYWGELIITLAFDFEIILRFLAALPDWRGFFSGGLNWLDLVLAIGSSIIQIPVIRRSRVYQWFTILQLARFYRVILVVPRMKPLLVRFPFFSHAKKLTMLCF